MAADQFDLICNGQAWSWAHGPKKPMSVHFRIDLAAKRFCLDPCEHVADIAGVSANTITLRRVVAAYPGDVEALGEVSRTTGVYRYLFRYPDALKWDNVEATCETAPFSGLPTTKF